MRNVYQYEDVKNILSWATTLQRSAHGHTNMFGIIHILFGITLSYSRLSIRNKKLQTYSILTGSLAMSILMYSYSLFSIANPTTIKINTIISYCIALFISIALIGIASHVYALWSRYLER